MMLDNRASFDTFDIHPAIQQGMINSGHYRATPIQEMAISEKNRATLLLLSPSGTGKTCTKVQRLNAPNILKFLRSKRKRI